MTWLQIAVEVSGDRVEEVSEAFNTIGALSVTVLDAGDEPLLEPAPGETPLWSNTRVIALFDEAQDGVGLKKQLQDVLEVPVPDLLIEYLPDRDWSNTWRDTFGAMQFGKRLWVCPVGESPPDPAAIVVHMDPGMAFGTGTHATTALCLEWLDAHPPVGRSVIDYGCGSGILAVAAHKLGATDVIAVDIDPQALQATRENTRRTGCDIEVFHPEALAQEAVDLVIANILANPLIESAKDLSRHVHAGGQIVMTGILAEQAEAVMAAYRGWFVFGPLLHREEWVLLEGLKQL
ncbi:MAG: 50S ribosomal protein L11 methyltransferase [Gammaproteobacteria bacterium]|nr:MAG: 50S ribosomal protein L11 methyltransferase [Gammaproteobacteria bacterium]